MNSLLKAFKEFYNEINGATLTGAIDVIVVEQADGSFICSPFHVRFGKLGVLRSREKIVDIEVNGEAVNIHMKLGESGEAFFVQECAEYDLEGLPANLATSPLPSGEFSSKFNDSTENDEKNSIEMKIRRNSTALSPSLSEKDKVYENQTSEYKMRRHSEKILDRRDVNEIKLEYTTEQIRQELAVKEALLNASELSVGEESPTISKISEVEVNNEKDSKKEALLNDETAAMQKMIIAENNIEEKSNKKLYKVRYEDGKATEVNASDNQKANTKDNEIMKKVQNTEEEYGIKELPETKSKKKRRKKSMMKKKAAAVAATAIGSSAINAVNLTNTPSSTRKSSSSSSGGSASVYPSDQNDLDTDPNQQSSNATSASIDDLAKSELAVTANDSLNEVNNVQDAMGTPRMCDFHFFSDTEVAASPYGSRPSTPIQSDSEFEISQRDNLVKSEKKSKQISSSTTASWKWGEFPITPAKVDSIDAVLNKEAKQAERNSTLSTMLTFMKETMKMRNKNTSEGVYLSDLMDTEGMDPDMVAMYFPQKNQPFAVSNLADGDDRESGNGTSLPHSPSSIENGASKSLEFEFDQDGKLFDKNVIALSLCGGLENNGPSEEEFERNLIEYADVCQNPLSIFMSSQLVVRLCGKYYSWNAACPIVMTAIAYRKPLSNEAIEQLMNINKSSSGPIQEIESNQNAPANESETKEGGAKANSNNRRNNAGGYSWWNWRRSTDNADKKTTTTNLTEQSKQPNVNEIVDGKTESADVSVATLSTDNMPNETVSQNAGNGVDLDATGSKHDDSISSELADISKNSCQNEKFRKTLRLTSEQIESLNLKPGMNELEFSVTTAYQGTSRCKCYVFRWKHTDKVVISDIDGTITKSDVLGHILPMVGKDWAQLGVAELFTKIEQNGYKLLYLSARAIGQSRATRDYLRSIQQGDVKLPNGPLLLNPTSLISAFHREVIERKPEQFKIACLSDIKALFPQNPFYAGYGNRINDVWAYCAVGIPIIRIFTINPKGELTHELNKTFQSTYRNMAYIVDQLFPPVNTDREESVEFSNFNFWRDPVLDIDCDQLLEPNVVTAATMSLSNSNIAQNHLSRAHHLATTPVTMDTELPTIPENIKV